MGVAGKVRIVCNSDLDPQDLETAVAAQAALRRSWCAGHPEEAPPMALHRYRALYTALTSGKHRNPRCAGSGAFQVVGATGFERLAPYLVKITQKTILLLFDTVLIQKRG